MLFPKDSGARGRTRAYFGALCLTGLTLLLSACKSETRMEAVVAEQGKAFHRFDRFQSVAKSGERMVAAGAFGTIAVSDDAGANWRRIELPAASGLVRTSACGGGTFLALDVIGRLWRGGPDAAHWDAVSIPATDAVLDLACTPDNRVWVVGARGAIFSSVDFGAHWTDQSLPEDLQLLNVQFPTATTGIITGEFGRVLVSADGGAHWKEAGSLGPDFYPQGMDFRDDRHGVVVGLSGAVLDTADGGVTWTRSKAPTEAPLYGVLSRASGQTVVVGAAGSAFVRTDGAWQPLAVGHQTDLRGLAAMPGGVAIAGAGTLAVLPLPVSTALSGTN
jgi:photosystem II stability/assembly factor-like uncharacterized protein